MVDSIAWKGERSRMSMPGSRMRRTKNSFRASKGWITDCRLSFAAKVADTKVARKIQSHI